MPDCYLGEIRAFPWNRTPAGWLACDGQQLPVREHQALYSLIGNRFGGDTKNFNLPDMRGRTPVHANGSRTSEATGVETVTLTIATMPAHQHALYAVTSTATTPDATANMLAAPQATSAGARPIYGTGKQDVTLDSTTLDPAGGNSAHSNMQPFLVLNYCIAIRGDYPPRSSD
ncbi:tail fiber protein [Sphingomonas sp. AOB5]|uniref:phage tail protein n=1 Tax=Sphingomonas sp. AOB5 TaxID=3034017 RepID=UPI0023F699F1|nr:tail fiber protein [Sphingomonas sp. AOB5]MDF7777497.1 tail fiber protein [Sphingomonas sp. AOB5]